jgi:glucose/arabinose dehydrogenase
MTRSFLFAAILSLSAATSLPALAQQTFDTQDVKLKAETIVDGLNHPWGLDFLPDGAAILTERSGRMRLMTDGKLSQPLKGVPEVFAQGQGGLLDVLAARDFADTGTIFFTYSQPGEGGVGTAVARARLVRDGRPRLADVKVIFSMDNKAQTRLQFGSRLVQAPDGSLFVTVGDQGQQDRAQDPQDAAGSVLHINADGTIPDDNPKPEGWLPQIWSIGHRNPEGAAWDPVTGALLTVEHGARGGDEVNRPEAGRNYGWPVISYGKNYDGSKIGEGTKKQGMEQPLHYWDPSIAPGGMAVYEGEMFPEWKGDLLVAALKFKLVSRLDRDEAGRIGKEERLFEDVFGRIRDVNVAPDGSLWLLTDEDDGAVIRISRADD